MSYEIFKQMKSQIEQEEENDGINLGQPENVFFRSFR